MCSKWKRSVVLPVVSLLAFSTATFAEPSCDFKGVSVGDKMTTEEVMRAFGITSFKNNPDIRSRDDQTLIDKFDIVAAAEIRDWNIGPYCRNDNIGTSCRIPFGVSIGNNNTPVSVFIGFSDDKVSSIGVAFNQNNWDDVKDMVNLKFGRNYKLERIPISIYDLPTKKFTSVVGENITYIEGGFNRKTNDRCRLLAQEFDLIYTHHDPLGPYHSILDIQLISKNF